MQNKVNATRTLANGDTFIFRCKLKLFNFALIIEFNEVQVNGKSHLQSPFLLFLVVLLLMLLLLVMVLLFNASRSACYATALVIFPS